MDITLHTKVAELLETYPELQSKLFELSPIFSKLKNPILRRSVAKVTSLQQAAGVAGISPAWLVQNLRETAGLTSMEAGTTGSNIEEIAKVPTWFDEQKIRASLDVRPIIEAGQSPMQEILKLSAQLAKGEILEIVTPFKPIPIIDKLQSKGFAVWTNGDKNFFIKE